MEEEPQIQLIDEEILTNDYQILQNKFEECESRLLQKEEALEHTQNRLNVLREELISICKEYDDLKKSQQNIVSTPAVTLLEQSIQTEEEIQPVIQTTEIAVETDQNLERNPLIDPISEPEELDDEKINEFYQLKHFTTTKTKNINKIKEYYESKLHNLESMVRQQHDQLDQKDLENMNLQTTIEQLKEELHLSKQLTQDVKHTLTQVQEENKHTKELLKQQQEDYQELMSKYQISLKAIEEAQANGPESSQSPQNKPIKPRKSSMPSIEQSQSASSSGIQRKSSTSNAKLLKEKSNRPSMSRSGSRNQTKEDNSNETRPRSRSPRPQSKEIQIDIREEEDEEEGLTEEINQQSMIMQTQLWQEHEIKYKEYINQLQSIIKTYQLALYSTPTNPMFYNNEGVAAGEMGISSEGSSAVQGTFEFDNGDYWYVPRHGQPSQGTYHHENNSPRNPIFHVHTSSQSQQQSPRSFHPSQQHPQYLHEPSHQPHHQQIYPLNYTQPDPSTPLPQQINPYITLTRPRSANSHNSSSNTSVASRSIKSTTSKARLQRPGRKIVGYDFPVRDLLQQMNS